jgi:hypothetical protein
MWLSMKPTCSQRAFEYPYMCRCFHARITAALAANEASAQMLSGFVEAPFDAATFKNKILSKMQNKPLIQPQGSQ